MFRLARVGMTMAATVSRRRIAVSTTRGAPRYTLGAVGAVGAVGVACATGVVGAVGLTCATRMYHVLNTDDSDPPPPATATEAATETATATADATQQKEDENALDDDSHAFLKTLVTREEERLNRVRQDLKEGELYFERYVPSTVTTVVAYASTAIAYVAGCVFGLWSSCAIAQSLVSELDFWPAGFVVIPLFAGITVTASSTLFAVFRLVLYVPLHAQLRDPEEYDQLVNDHIRAHDL